MATWTSRLIAGRAQVGYHFSLPPAFTIVENQTAGTADITILDNVFVGPDKPLVSAAPNLKRCHSTTSSAAGLKACASSVPPHTRG